jgi:hypothetical protein
MALDIGRVAFQAYTDSLGNQSADGKPLTNWEDLDQAFQNAWRAAGIAVLQDQSNYLDDIDV